MDLNYPLLTRGEIVDFLRGELGVPLSLSRFEKICMNGGGPPVARYWGKRPLYERAASIAWAEGRMRKPAQATA